MRIGIDISQLAYPNTGVATFLYKLVQEMIRQNSKNTYVLFYSSLRKELPITNYQLPINEQYPNVQIKRFKFPPTVLDWLWNRLHIVPIETFIGPVDVFISSDWTQPPSKAKKVTILYDLIVYKYPQETAQKIIEVQKRKLKWVKKEVDKILCISEATQKDAEDILGIQKDRLEVIYPGM